MRVGLTIVALGLLVVFGIMASKESRVTETVVAQRVSQQVDVASAQDAGEGAEVVGEAEVEAGGSVGPGLITTVEDLLGRVEESHEQIDHFVASIAYTRTFALAGDSQSRQGQMLLVSRDEDGDGVDERKFYIQFYNLVIDKDLTKEVKEYVFDGNWLVEREPGIKFIMRRQIAPPGESVDPLRVGAGPFPMPFGQKRADVLRDFDVEMKEPFEGLEEEPLRIFLNKDDSTYQIEMRPKASMKDIYEFTSVRIWYMRDTLLPRMIVLEDFDGDQSVLQVGSMNVNNASLKMDDGIFDTSVPPESEGWDVVSEPWRGAGGG